MVLSNRYHHLELNTLFYASNIHTTTIVFILLHSKHTHTTKYNSSVRCYIHLVKKIVCKNLLRFNFFEDALDCSILSLHLICSRVFPFSWSSLNCLFSSFSHCRVNVLEVVQSDNQWYHRNHLHSQMFMAFTRWIIIIVPRIHLHYIITLNDERICFILTMAIIQLFNICFILRLFDGRNNCFTRRMRLKRKFILKKRKNNLPHNRRTLNRCSYTVRFSWAVKMRNEKVILQF